MRVRDDPSRKVEALRARNTSLNEAILRISASLDLETVLKEVVDSARALTGARYGAVATVDESGVLQDYATTGLSDEEQQRLSAWSDGPQFFKHVLDLAGPLRRADLSDYVRKNGFSGDSLPAACAFQVAPMLHRGVNAGILFLARKANGGEFMGEDEEVLLLIASQAAASIANTRKYRAEQLNRADLESLVETSPVGVVVFEAVTGSTVSVNLEAKRIAQNLRLPGKPIEAILEVATCRFADGREISLDQFSLVQVLRSAETVRAVEVVISIPDGRSVTVLVSATPVRGEDGAVTSMVVTMQDMAALQELDRTRAEFLSMVSHELRAPLTSIKGSATTVLNASRELDPAEVRQFFRIIDEQANLMDSLIGDLLDVGRTDTGMLSVTPEPSEVTFLVDQARNTFLSGGARHNVLIDLPPDLPPVLADRKRIVQVLNNLLSNAARHSAATAPIRISAERDGVYVVLTVADEGRGIAPELLGRLFRKYGRKEEDSGVSGGLGLAICKGLVEAHGGRIRAESPGVGKGTRFIFTIPVADTGSDDATAGDARHAPGQVSEGRQPTTVLIVDDDPQTLSYVRDVLADAGYYAVVTADHRELSSIIEAEKPKLVLLDLMLPGTDGIELMRTIPELATLPVIFISGYGRDETIARALEAGAEDYIVKPFSPTELTARIGAILRRRANPDRFVLGELAIDYDRREVKLANRPVALTATEYEVLRVLSLCTGRI
ncbi:MAG: response regulator, partial [Gammaproteobacteria bacterium]|nr:response regulator [Gammaproteobacteria bacterium]